MAQEIQSNITLKEEDKIVSAKQGGTLIWHAYERPYFNFSFVPPEGTEYDEVVKAEFLEIGEEIIKHFSKEKVVIFYCTYDVKEREDDRKHKMTPPVYVEDGKVNEFKRYLINSNRKDLLWTDYMYYISKITESKLLRLFGIKEMRSYARDIYIYCRKN